MTAILPSPSLFGKHQERHVPDPNPHHKLHQDPPPPVPTFNMINTTNLNTILTHNLHPDLYTQYFLMARSGALFGYSLPADMRTVRDVAALLSQLFIRHPTESGTAGPEVDAVTVGIDRFNVVASRCKSGLYLVLVGPSGSSSPSRFHLHREIAQESTSGAAQREEDNWTYVQRAETGDPLLRMQRRKAKKMAHYFGVSISDAVAKDLVANESSTIR